MARLVSKQTGSPAKGADKVVTWRSFKWPIIASSILLAALVTCGQLMNAKSGKSFTARELMLRANEIGVSFTLRHEGPMRSDGTGFDTRSIWEGEAGGRVEQQNYRLDTTLDAILSWEPIAPMSNLTIPGLDETMLHFERVSYGARKDPNPANPDFRCEMRAQRQEFMVRLSVDSGFDSPLSLADCARLIKIIDARLETLLTTR